MDELKKREERPERDTTISGIARIMCLAFPGRKSRREGFYAVRMRHPPEPKIARSLWETRPLEEFD
jgi:hypothetical protein